MNPAFIAMENSALNSSGQYADHKKGASQLASFTNQLTQKGDHQ